MLARATIHVEIEDAEFPEFFENGSVDDGKTGEGPMNVSGEIERLKIKLQELEAKKKELAETQAKVDADIQAVKRTVQLFQRQELKLCVPTCPLASAETNV
jgi:hypothetical protein